MHLFKPIREKSKLCYNLYYLSKSICPLNANLLCDKSPFFKESFDWVVSLSRSVPSLIGSLKFMQKAIKVHFHFYLKCLIYCIHL